jgi:adenylate kinase
MIKPNWEIFRAKFSENPQSNFEWFCYLLFSSEFNRPFGIFRYKNQSAIETDPIEIDGQFIGWQAKFYDSTLSNHKEDLIDTIDRAKRDYPKISKIVIYTNQEWGQYKGKEPQGKKDAESKAKELGIELDWRTASFFESSFVVVDNEIISQHFFCLDKSIVNFLKEQEIHSENILFEIQTSIVFNDQAIEIDRTADLKNLKESSAQVIILSGVAGVGKTALIKNYYEQIKGEIPLYIFKATEFDIANINILFGDSNYQDFVNAHNDIEDKIIAIDSAEKLIDLKNTDPFKEFLTYLINNHWKIIFTTRDNYLEDLNYQFFEIYKIAPSNISLHNLDTKKLNSLSDKYDFSLPKDVKLLDLLKSPFYLNKFLKFYEKGEETSYSDFKDNLWNNIIKKAIPERELCFLKIAYERASEGQFFVNPDCDTNILNNELKNDGILGHESPHGYFITHDIYEEWALEKIIETEFIKKTDNKAFFERIGDSLPIRRSFYMEG